MEEGQAYSGKSGFSKGALILIIGMLILIPTALSVFLGIRLHTVQKELEELKAQAKEAASIRSAELPREEAPDSETEDFQSVYTADSVNVSKRDSTGAQATDITEQSIQDGDVRKVYLTFDDGPSGNTSRILDILAEYDVKATFFVVGKEDEKYKEVYNRIVDEGHTLGMHSYSHKYDEIYQSVESYAQDLSRLQEFLYETTGVWCRYCRFPGGSSNTVSTVDMNELIAYLDEQDITYFDWNIASGDASSSYISADAILNNCIPQIPKFNECMILMHDASNKNTTVEALPRLIERIQAMEDTIIVPITEDTELIQHISNE
ncbi:MAG: polysaccharide deacetylase [Clostridiales bacterium]|nr:polysaccharide deacetylase [Clostridiales bacterium]